MIFKLTYTIAPMPLADNHKFEFEVKKEGGVIHFELQKITKAELKAYQKDGDYRCVASVERVLSDIRQSLFEKMKSEVPTGIAPVVAEITKELDDGIFQVISSIRWKMGFSSLHNFVRFGDSLHWSIDNKNWKAVPKQRSLNLKLDFPVHKWKNLDELNNLQELIASNTVAPLGHELFAEAWSQRLTNPRSSLVIGIAAAEMGFKECVGKLIPEAKWLIQNVPSPPLVTMLKEFLPTLPVKATVRGKTLPPPKNILETLRNGINIRNKIAHGSFSPLREDTLEDVLRAIRDILYLLDIYCGFTWAENNISIETRKDLINDSK